MCVCVIVYILCMCVSIVIRVIDYLGSLAEGQIYLLALYPPPLSSSKVVCVSLSLLPSPELFSLPVCVSKWLSLRVCQ